MLGDYDNQIIVITDDPSSDALFIDFGDEIIFNAYVENNQLIIDIQTINAEQEFDVVTLSAVAEMNEDETVAMEFTHNVDDEGLSNCTMILTK